MSLSASDLEARQPDGSARRMRLREFQAQLVERMQHAHDSEAAQASQLGLLMGGQRWLLDLQTAGEIVSAHDVTPVPLTHPWYRGLINIRGNLVGVIDLACFNGGPQSTFDKDSRIVAFGAALGINCGLLVSGVLGLRHAAGMQEQPATEEGCPWEGRRFMDEEANLWIELDLEGLVRHPDFLQVGR